MPTQHFFSSRGLKLSYFDWGNPDAPALVLLHGGLEHAHVWDKVAEALCDRWRIVVPDLRGHGDSDWSAGGAYGIADYIPDVVALIELLSIDKFSLVGHSLGGNIAIHYAAAYPEKVEKLCTIEGLGLSPIARKEKNKKSRLEQLRDWSDRVNLVGSREPRQYASAEEAADSIMRNDKHVDRETALHIATYGTRQVADGAFSWKYDENLKAWGVGDFGSPEPSDFWRAIECESLLVYGAESWASNPAADGRAKHFRQAEVVLVENAGHNVHHHQFEVFLAHLEKFLTP